MNHYVLDTMSRNPVLSALGRDARAVAAEARERGVEHVVVTDGAHPLSVVTTSDLEHAAPGLTLSAFANRELITVEECDTLESAEAIMECFQVDCLPVTNWEGLLVGVITLGDIRRHWERCPASSPTRLDALCVACGSTTDLVRDSDVGIAFCRECLSQTTSPEQVGDDIYFTLGGGD